MNGWVIFGALLGAGAVTGIGVVLKVRELQSPEFTARAEGLAEVAAANALANHYGLTPARIQQIGQIAARFR